MSKLKMSWQYDKRTDAYLFGYNSQGGGVFQDNNLWYGNSVVIDIVIVGPFSTKEEAQLAVEKDYEKRVTQ